MTSTTKMPNSSSGQTYIKTQTHAGTQSHTNFETQATQAFNYDAPYDAEETIASDYEAVD